MTVLINLIRALPCGFWCQLSSFILIVSIPITSWNTNYLMMMLMGFNSWNKLFLIYLFFVINLFILFVIGYLIKTLLSATKRWTSIYISESFFMISYSCEKNIKKNREYVEKLLQRVVKSPSIDRICSPFVMFIIIIFSTIYILGVMDLISSFP
jgi:hypothetical protein